MPLQFITADERMKRGDQIKMVVLGQSGIGKTSLLWTLDPETTLFVDLEAGDLAVEGWAGTSIDVRKESLNHNLHPWDFARDIAVLIGGPNPAAQDIQGVRNYSAGHYAYASMTLGDPSMFSQFQTVFVDSITVSGRLCFDWCKRQPEAFSEKTGKPDGRGAYGLHGQQMISFLTQLQHTQGKNIVLVGILDHIKDDFGRFTWEPQIDGSKTGREFPGIVDEVISMAEMKTPEGESYRAFVCQTLNPHGYPAKDRSGRLDVIEEPHLGKLMDKMRAGSRAQELVHTLPAEPTQPQPEPAQQQPAA